MVTFVTAYIKINLLKVLSHPDLVKNPFIIDLLVMVRLKSTKRIQKC